MSKSETQDGPLVSVIIPVYNGTRHLETAIDSVLAQTYRRLELLVVDDGSSDDSLAMARRYADAVPDRVTALQHPGGVNLGVAETRNLAAVRAKGTYLAFLDADDRWLPTKLEKQVALMESDPDIGLTYTKSLILREGAGHDFIPGVDELGDEPPGDHKQALVKIILVTLNYIFSSVMVRKDCFEAAGRFPERLPHQSEDRIMVAKVSANHTVKCLPEVLCEYLAHDSSYSTGLVAAGTAPIVFFDLQVRVVDWLVRENGRADWARDIAGSVLPIYFVAALFCRKTPRSMAGVLKNLSIVVRHFPDLLPLFLLRSLSHTRLQWLVPRAYRDDSLIPPPRK